MALKYKKRRKKNRKTYGERDAILAQLGFASYKAYLASHLWDEIRLRVLTREGWRCWSCGSRATQIHHCEYTHANLGGHSDRGLIPVCKSCHQQAEISIDGPKKTLGQANSELGEARNRNGLGELPKERTHYEPWECKKKMDGRTFGKLREYKRAKRRNAIPKDAHVLVSAAKAPPARQDRAVVMPGDGSPPLRSRLSRAS